MNSSLFVASFHRRFPNRINCRLPASVAGSASRYWRKDCRFRQSYFVSVSSLVCSLRPKRMNRLPPSSGCESTPPSRRHRAKFASIALSDRELLLLRPNRVNFFSIASSGIESLLLRPNRVNFFSITSSGIRSLLLRPNRVNLFSNVS